MSFTGNTTNTPSDLFQLGDYNHVTEDQSLVAVSSLTSFNNQVIYQMYKRFFFAFEVKCD